MVAAFNEGVEEFEITLWLNSIRNLHEGKPQEDLQDSVFLSTATMESHILREG
jgi:hypothetical protein